MYFSAIYSLLTRTGPTNAADSSRHHYPTLRRRWRNLPSLTVSEDTLHAIENVRETIQSISVSDTASILVHLGVSHLYSSDLLPEYLEDARNRDNNPQRWSSIVMEAAEMVHVHGHLISAMIGKDVTKEDADKGTTFWDERQSGRGPYLFRQIVETVLGSLLWSHPTTRLLYRGSFRDVFECDKECKEWIAIIVSWFRLYVEKGIHFSIILAHLISVAKPLR